MVHYIYKSEQKQDQSRWYIDCEWMNNIDFETNHSDLHLCTITLNNVSDFWSGSITRKDLDNFVNQNTSFDKLNQVVTSGLQGEQDYEGQALSWKIFQKENTCKMVLIGYMAGSLPYELGYINIPKVPAPEKHKVMRNWMENTIKQCLTFKQIQKALLERNRDLVVYKEKMEKELEDLTREKVESDMATIQKIKLLVNSKKRRIHKVMMERDRLLKQLEAQQAVDENNDRERQSTSPTSPKPVTTTKKRGRPSSKTTGNDENTQSKRTRTTVATSSPTPPSPPSLSNRNNKNTSDDKHTNDQPQGIDNGINTEESGEPAIVPKTNTSAPSSSTLKPSNGNNSTKPKPEAIVHIASDNSTDDDDDDDMFNAVSKLRRRIIPEKSTKNKGKEQARNTSDDSDTD
ncbi:hypothetical protein BDA99DRAFT_563712 [Phascolomyces articulosus]|uniref:Uncharacterized protein n=1 Tax=Phascolomyces articulosus TaxID=60185 RepID=A0AAD5JSD2_9FUNG|nr:hypothetical protein BDA99DRAFT_563712 [Phascolomyces articulosus]